MAVAYIGRVVTLGHDEDWREYALCSGMDPRLFSYAQGYDRDHNRLVRQTVLDVCLECPVMIQCGESASPEDFDWTSRGGDPPRRGPGRPRKGDKEPRQSKRSLRIWTETDYIIADKFIVDRGGKCDVGHDLNLEDAVRIRHRKDRVNTASCRVCSNSRRTRKRAKIEA